MQSETPYQPKVGIVILNYNGCQYLKEFIPTLLTTTYPNYFVLVYDNHSTDDSEAYIRSFPQILWGKNTCNDGYAHGYNKAIEHCPPCDYVVLLNSDVAITPHWLQPLINLLESDQTIGACQPKILSYHQPEFFEYAGAAGGWIDTLGYPFCRGRVIINIEKDLQQYNDAQEIFWASGAAFCIKKELFTTMGGFDALFFAHHEEIDLCWRLQLAHYKIMVCPESIIYHVGGGTLPISPRKLFLNHRNSLIVLLKNLPDFQKIFLLPLRLITDFCISLTYLLKLQGSLFVGVYQAYFAVLQLVLQGKIKKSDNTQSITQLTGVYKGSLIAAYYLLGKKTFSKFNTPKKIQ